MKVKVSRESSQGAENEIVKLSFRGTQGINARDTQISKHGLLLGQTQPWTAHKISCHYPRIVKREQLKLKTEANNNQYGTPASFDMLVPFCALHDWDCGIQDQFFHGFLL